MLQRLEVQKLRIILSLLSASHLVFDPIIRIMKGGFTTVMVGSFLLTILPNIANSTHSAKAIIYSLIDNRSITLQVYGHNCYAIPPWTVTPDCFALQIGYFVSAPPHVLTAVN
ncbi:unnamed protein product [Allacma fusca]|uniref:Uncharacterized protein n=1 Tax=Allacma fusca TaxID=39272 RepID=A0A8J2KAN9_9HEXA|nr:unnamed protein product [Allacma fusca]